MEERKMLQFFTGLIVCAILFFTQVSSVVGQTSARSRSGEMFPADTSVKIIKLPNGFTCYLKKCKSSDENVYMQFSVKAGFGYEDSNEIGLSHVIEHMAKNTKHFKESISYFMKKGLPRDNRSAATGSYNTNYLVNVPATRKDIIAEVIYHWSECAQLIDMSEENIENQRRSVILEVSRGTHPEVSAISKTNEFLLGNKKLIAEGHLQNLKKFKLSDVRTLYEKVYVPERQVLVIAGDIDIKEISAQVRQRFSYLKKGKIIVPEIDPELPSDKLLVVTDSALEDSQIWAIYQSKLPALGTVDYYRTVFEHQLLSYLLEIRFSSINDKNSDGHIKMWPGRQALDEPTFVGDMFIQQIRYSGKLFNESWKAYSQEWERLKRFGFTKTELVKAAGRLRNEWNEKSAGLCEEIVRYAINAYLENTTIPDLQQLLRLQQHWLDEMDVHSVNAILKTTCNDKDRRIALLTNDLQLQQPIIEKAIKDLDAGVVSETLMPHVDDNIVELMTLEEVKTLKPASITSVNSDKQLNITQIVLSNGAKVVLKPLKTSSDLISINGFNESTSALMASAAGRQQVTNNLFVWNQIGAGRFSNKQLASFTNFKSILYHLSANEYGSQVTVTCTRSTDLEAGLQLIYLLLNFPDTNELSFKQAINSITSNVPLSNNIDEGLVDSIIVALGKSPAKQVDVNEIKTTKLQTLIKNRRRLFDPGAFTFVIAGNFTNEAILPLITKYLGADPSTAQKYEHAPDNRDSVKYFYLNKPNVVLLRMHIKGLFDDVPKQHVILKALEEILNIEGILKAQETGLAYDASLGLYTTMQQEYELSLRMRLDTASCQKGLDFWNKLLERVRKEEFGDTLVNYVRKKLLAEFQNKMSNPFFWTTTISEQLLKNRPFSDIFEYKEAVEKLTKDDIVKGAHQYFNKSLIHYFISLPEKEN